MPSTVVMNRRFLGYIACARVNFPSRHGLDGDLIKFVGELEHNFPVQFSGALAALQLS